MDDLPQHQDAGAYQEVTWYSPMVDCNVTRLSTCNRLGHEFYALIPRVRARGWRDLRNEALSQLVDAIRAGQPPGEIKLRLDA